eukprot:COSAG06_NODE_4794_length_3948_cov_10.764095_3_plen_57_part_00
MCAMCVCVLCAVCCVYIRYFLAEAAMLYVVGESLPKTGGRSAATRYRYACDLLYYK